MSRVSAMIAAALALLPQAVFACPGCKDNLTEAHVNAYGWSIIFMMSMPFLILGSLSAYFYYEVRRARRLTATQRGTRSALDVTIGIDNNLSHDAPSPLARG